jgi:hypothetical protein
MIWHENGNKKSILKYSISKEKIHIFPYLLSKALSLIYWERREQSFLKWMD